MATSFNPLTVKPVAAMPAEGGGGGVSSEIKSIENTIAEDAEKIATQTRSVVAVLLGIVSPKFTKLAEAWAGWGKTSRIISVCILGLVGLWLFCFVGATIYDFLPSRGALRHAGERGYSAASSYFAPKTAPVAHAVKQMPDPSPATIKRIEDGDVATLRDAKASADASAAALRKSIDDLNARLKAVEDKQKAPPPAVSPRRSRR